MVSVFTVKISGEAGQGIKLAGQLLAKVATRSGYHVYTYSEYPSLIRGGRNEMWISISPEPVLAPQTKVDLEVNLSKHNVDNLSAVVGLVKALGGNLSILKYLLSEQQLAFAPQEVDFGKYSVLAPREVEKPRMLVNGNEAVALGAIAGGLQFAAIYPMTPITNLLTVLADWQEKYGFVYKQPEDELAAVNMAIGASFAGSRSLTATSGGGFCLMTEGLGLAGMTETPLVVIEGMRAGPATGLPTWSEQGDLQFVLHAAQGEFPRIVLAPGDVVEAFYLTRQAFDLAEKYRTPVIVLVDKNLCESDQSIVILSEAQDTSPVVQGDNLIRRLPGKGEFFIANSDEHDEIGYSTDDGGNHVAQMQKRMQKLMTCEQEDMAPPTLYGPAKAKTTIVSWGSNKGAILEALKSLPDTNFLHLTWLNPFPSETVKKILSTSQRIIDIEANYSGQLANLIREKTGIEITERLLKYDGRPIYQEEIIDRVRPS